MIPSARRGRGRPSTRTKEERKIRRREVGRASQQRYRTRMKKKEDERHRTGVILVSFSIFSKKKVPDSS